MPLVVVELVMTQRISGVAGDTPSRGCCSALHLSHSLVSGHGALTGVGYCVDPALVHTIALSFELSEVTQLSTTLFRKAIERWHSSIVAMPGS